MLKSENSLVDSDIWRIFAVSIKNKVMLGIKNNEEILYGQYADTLYEEYKKRYGEPVVKDLAN